MTSTVYPSKVKYSLSSSHGVSVNANELTTYGWLAGIAFNLVVFGTRYSFMSDQVVPYNESSEASALAWIKQNVNADWGGTEIRATLQAVCNVPVTEGKYMAFRSCVACIACTRCTPRITCLQQLVNLGLTCTWHRCSIDLAIWLRYCQDELVGCFQQFYTPLWIFATS